ncbi:hypothetical protein [Nocardioides gansuensis]|nr:hypothetical protein [Nocardioides gansuensis]
MRTDAIEVVEETLAAVKLRLRGCLHAGAAAGIVVPPVDYRSSS